MTPIDILPFSAMTPLFLLAFIVIVAWSLIWKGIALWRAAKNDHIAWFIVLLVVNTVGILEILYLCCFSKSCLKKKVKKR